MELAECMKRALGSVLYRAQCDDGTERAVSEWQLSEISEGQICFWEL